MAHYIHNGRWSVPQAIMDAFPTLLQKLNLITIPIIQKDGKIIWKKSHDGNLSFKDAYLFHNGSNSQNLSWAKLIWNKAIPQSKYFLMWRILLDKRPTDEHLINKGSKFPSICNLCNLTSESSQHLFMDCLLAIQV